MATLLSHSRATRHNDLLAIPKHVSRAIELATEFWVSNSDPEIRQRMFGAMHWHLFGQSYAHTFEQFTAQYTVLDTCFAIHKSLTGKTGKVMHGDRPKLLCTTYNLTVPHWAEQDLNTGKVPIAELRHALIHEGRYGNAPTGFDPITSIPGVVRELTVFNTRLILALLGIKNEYTRSPVYTRDVWDFKLPKRSSRIPVPF